MILLIEEKRQQLTELCRKFAVKRLDIFGSAVDDTFDPARSDLDFLVEFEVTALIGRADQFFGLLASLRDLFKRKVDLVEYRAIKNPYFKEDVDQTRLKLYGA